MLNPKASVLPQAQEGVPANWAPHPETQSLQPHTSSELQSKLLNGGYIGIIYGTTIGVIKGDTRSLDYSSSGKRTPDIAPESLKPGRSSVGTFMATVGIFHEIGQAMESAYEPLQTYAFGF